MTRCIYCNKEKEKFTKEHIFPDSLGGDFFPDEFQTMQVCKDCNSTCGIFVDAPFIKDVFTSHDQSNAYRKYIDPTKAYALPMAYMGHLGEEDWHDPKGRVCEVWFGALLGIVCHIHQKDDPRWDCIAGGNFMARKRDKGFLVVFFQSEDDISMFSLLLSCQSKFKKLKKISGGREIRIEDPDRVFGEEFFSEPTNDEAEVREKLRSTFDGEHRVHFEWRKNIYSSFTFRAIQMDS